MDYVKIMAKEFEPMRYKHGIYQVFEDFLELAALSISNRFDLIHYDKREARYMEIIKRYDKTEAELFPRLLSILIKALDREPNDYLGKLFMEMELYDNWKGQFFTSMDVSRIMAEMTIQEHLSHIENNGSVSVNEPTVGGGVTIIALHNTLKSKGYNPQQVLRVVAQDIDKRAVHMSYIQFSLLGLDAVLLLGDTLALTFRETWRTPMHFMRPVKENKADKDSNKLRQLQLF